MIKKNDKKKKGFTLVELIIVLAIIAVIAAIAIPNFTKIRENAKTNADKQTLEVLERITNVLLTDETIKGQGTITLTFPEEAKDKDKPTVTATGITTKNEEDLSAAFNDVKKPQKENGTGYSITIKENKLTAVVEPTGEEKK